LWIDNLDYEKTAPIRCGDVFELYELAGAKRTDHVGKKSFDSLAVQQILIVLRCLGRRSDSCGSNVRFGEI